MTSGTEASSPYSVEGPFCLSSFPALPPPLNLISLPERAGSLPGVCFDARPAGLRSPSTLVVWQVEPASLPFISSRHDPTLAGQAQVFRDKNSSGKRGGHGAGESWSLLLTPQAQSKATWAPVSQSVGKADFWLLPAD